MGGCGSGRRREKPVLEDGLALDLCKLLRDGLIKPGVTGGSLVWRESHSGQETASLGYMSELDIHTRRGSLALQYRVTDGQGERHDVAQLLPLEALTQPFGGLAWYFRCPRTGRRCRKLYLPPGAHRFAARQAWRIGYLSQRQAPHDRAITQAQKIRDRLHASPSISDSVVRDAPLAWLARDRRRSQSSRPAIPLSKLSS